MSIGAVWHDEETGWLIRAGADTQTGHYRETNEDFALLDPQLPLALVLDGMGGQTHGREAAITGAEAIRARVHRSRGEPPEALLEAAFRAGHDAIVRWQAADSDRRGCSATVVGAWMQSGRAYVAWLGDCRAYHLSGGRLDRLTWDHDYRTFLIRTGRLTEEEARYARIRNCLLSYLGNWELAGPLEVISFAPQPGDRLVLATNGVTGFLDDNAFLYAHHTISDPTTCAEAINEYALRAESRDNCTCAVIAFA